MKILKLPTLICITILGFMQVANAQIGINTLTPDSSSALHIVSDEKGVLFPNMNNTMRESKKEKAAHGLFVFDPSDRLYYYRDTNTASWTAVNPWRVNDGMTSASNFIHLGNKYKNASVYIGSYPQKNIDLSINYKLQVGGSIYATEGFFLGDNEWIKYQSLSSCMSYKHKRDFPLSLCSGNEYAMVIKTVKNIQLNASSGRVIFETDLAEAKKDIFAQGDIIAKKNLVSDSNIIAKGEFIGNGIMPVGSVIMYDGRSIDTYFDNTGKGKDNTPAQGWAICNGGNGTPDLRGRFVVGAGQRSLNGSGYPMDARETENRNYSIGDKGGVNKYATAIDEMPKHRHFFYVGNRTTGMGSSEGHRVNGGEDLIETTYSGGNGSLSQGQSISHENRPPYYALIYIIRVK